MSRVELDRNIELEERKLEQNNNAFFILCSDSSLSYHKECYPNDEAIQSLELRQPPPDSPHECESLISMEIRKARGSENQPLVCICNRPNDPLKFMLSCEFCEGWFHGECVDVSKEDADSIMAFFCPKCCESDSCPYSETVYKQSTFMAGWNERKVTSWLGEFNLKRETIVILKQLHIDGAILHSLTRSELMNLGIRSKDAGLIVDGIRNYERFVNY